MSKRKRGRGNGESEGGRSRGERIGPRQRRFRIWKQQLVKLEDTRLPQVIAKYLSRVRFLSLGQNLLQDQGVTMLLDNLGHANLQMLRVDFNYLAVGQLSGGSKISSGTSFLTSPLFPATRSYFCLYVHYFIFPIFRRSLTSARFPCGRLFPAGEIPPLLG